MKSATLFLLPVSMTIAAALPASAPAPPCVSQNGARTPCGTLEAGTFIGVKADPPTGLERATGKMLKEEYRHLALNNTRVFKKVRPIEEFQRPSIRHGRSLNSTIKYGPVEKRPKNVDKVGEENGSEAAYKKPADEKAVEGPKTESKKSDKNNEDKKHDSVETHEKKKPYEEGEEEPTIQPPRKAITSDEVVKKLQDVQVIIPKLEKTFKHFGIEGSGMRPDRERSKNFKNIQNWLREWRVAMRDLQNRLQTTAKWDLVDQMEVAQQYFKFAGDVESMLKTSTRHVDRFDKSSHMRCEITTSLALLYREYVAVADHLYTMETLTHAHDGGRLFRSKFQRLLPMWWDITHTDPKSGEGIADWSRWNDKPYDPAYGEFEKTVNKWKAWGPSTRVGKCSEMEPHGSW